ncbi:alpha-ketoglutarate-dependent dioxygenase AlkB [Streptomyces sp. NPDC093252]|uniref:alpha-ketoglutarate-dependent dioxygenase AlkB family protein n=1 Tax=Streptomyces sp. NPDC093252 TaxID=3154980 RepID=UPI00341C34AF
MTATTAALFDLPQTPREPVSPAPGAHLRPGWLTADQQTWLVHQYRTWAAGPVPARAPSIRGHRMSVRSLCLGWHWQPYRYSRTADDVNGAAVLPLPDWLVTLGRRALTDTGHPDDLVAGYTPDAALVNFYDPGAHLGMHQDHNEPSPAPVISLSIGDTCTFRFGNTRTRTKPYTDLPLASGDLFVFGGPSRLAFHGVPRIHPGTAPAGCGLDAGRLRPGRRPAEHHTAHDRPDRPDRPDRLTPTVGRRAPAALPPAAPPVSSARPGPVEPGPGRAEAVPDRRQGFGAAAHPGPACG